jgi:hypothetical protein
MSATPFHEQDPFDLEIQQICDETEKAIYGETGGVGTDRNITRLFLDGFDRIANCALAHDVMKTHRWGMKGITMVALADRLGTDHGTISRWYHQGDLPQSLERFLKANPNKPSDPDAPINKAFNARHRNAFLFVARYLHSKMPNRSPCDTGLVLEIHAEFLFDILDDRGRWEAARAENDYSMAEEIVRSCQVDDREIVPSWHTKKQGRRTRRLLNRLGSDNRLAFKYLCLLQRCWLGVFVLTWAAAEATGWL